MDVGNLLAIPPALNLPSPAESERTGHGCGYGVGVEGDHRYALHQYHHMARMIGFMSVLPVTADFS